MSHQLVTTCLYEPTSFPFWWETFSIFLGDVAATVFLALSAYALFYLLKYPGFRVGAGWSFSGWDSRKMGRFPNASDDAPMELWPNVSVVSRDTDVKRVIVAIWVRERAEVVDPGEIYGVRHLHKEGMPAEHRTTGADPLNLPGPKILCKASQFQKITHTPVFMQTSDGRFHKAQSPGNPIKGIAKLRYRVQDASDAARQWFLEKLG
jgi:hypothetical protein